MAIDFEGLLRQQGEAVNMASLEVSTLSELTCQVTPVKVDSHAMRIRAVELRSYAQRLQQCALVFAVEAGRLEALAFAADATLVETRAGEPGYYEPSPEDGC